LKEPPDYPNAPASSTQDKLQEPAVTIAIGLTRTVHGRLLHSALHKANTIIIAFRSKNPLLQLTLELSTLFIFTFLLP